MPTGSEAKPIAIATSDWHLDEYAWADRREISGDSLAAFRQIVSYAVKHRLPILAAGDLLDRKPNLAGLISQIRPQLNRLQEAGVPLLLVQGQHELQPDTPWLCAIHDWPIWLWDKPQGVEVGGLNVYGIDWTPRDELPEALAAVPQDIDVLVMHQVCHEFMGGITVAEMDFGQVPHAELLVVGDYHEHRTHAARGAQGQQLKVLSPGSTNMRKIDEESTKRFFVVNDDLSYKSVRLRTRPYLEWTVSSEEELNHFVEVIRSELKDTTSLTKLPESLCKPLLRVKYMQGLTDAYPRIESAVGEWAHLFTKVIAPKDEDEEFEGEETYEEVEELGLTGCLPLLVTEEEEPEVFGLCHSLLSSTEPQPVLAAARDEYLKEEE